MWTPSIYNFITSVFFNFLALNKLNTLIRISVLFKCNGQTKSINCYARHLSVVQLIMWKIKYSTSWLDVSIFTKFHLAKPRICHFAAVGISTKSYLYMQMQINHWYITSWKVSRRCHLLPIPPRTDFVLCFKVLFSLFFCFWFSAVD